MLCTRTVSSRKYALLPTPHHTCTCTENQKFLCPKILNICLLDACVHVRFFVFSVHNLPHKSNGKILQSIIHTLVAVLHFPIY